MYVMKVFNFTLLNRFNEKRKIINESWKISVIENVLTDPLSPYLFAICVEILPAIAVRND